MCPESVQSLWKYYSSDKESFVDSGAQAISRCFCGGTQQSSTGGEIKAEENSPVPNCEWWLKTDAKKQIIMEIKAISPGCPRKRERGLETFKISGFFYV